MQNHTFVNSDAVHDGEYSDHKTVNNKLSVVEDLLLLAALDAPNDSKTEWTKRQMLFVPHSMSSLRTHLWSSTPMELKLGWHPKVSESHSICSPTSFDTTLMSFTKRSIDLL